MNEKFMLKPLPKMETEIALVKAMVDVLMYENNYSKSPNELVIEAAHEILANKVLEIRKVIQNPSRYDKFTPEDDLIGKA